MRDNIDLTSNRMFEDSRDLISDRLFRGSFNFKVIPHKKRIFPWERSPFLTKDDTDDISIIPISKRIFPLGDRNQREDFILLSESVFNITERKYCDRCGGIIDKAPWNHHYGLCKKCTDLMEREYGNKRKGAYPWDEFGR